MRKIVLVTAAILLAGCVSATDTSVIYLSDLQPLPEVELGAIVPLRVAVAAVISPQGTVDSYQPLLDYMSRELDRPVELVQRRTYAEINDLIESGQVDVAFVCTSAYVAGERDFGMQLLTAPQVNGEPVYYSVLIVPADSTATSMADLEGQVFAYTDPMSTTGRAYAIYLVQQLGREPDEFFARTFFTYSHDDAIRAVANGVADGATVDSLVYDFAVDRDPLLAEQTRVIHASEPYGMPPVVLSPHARPQLRAELEGLLFGLTDSREGLAVLDAMGVERFVPVEDSRYDTVRELLDSVGPMTTETE